MATMLTGVWAVTASVGRGKMALFIVELTWGSNSQYNLEEDSGQLKNQQQVDLQCFMSRIMIPDQKHGVILIHAEVKTLYV